MLSKISNEEIVKGFIMNYPSVKNAFKETLHDNGFRWSKGWERQSMDGREGVWFNPVSKLSIRIRWGMTSPNAIVYVEKEFFDKIAQFFKCHNIVNGMASPNRDYNSLNKGELGEVEKLSEPGEMGKDSIPDREKRLEEIGTETLKEKEEIKHDI